MARGKLINVFMAVIYRLDTTATDAAGGYDDEFGEIIPLSDSTQLGIDGRVEQAAIRLPVQIDRNPEWGKYVQLRQGINMDSSILLTAHRETVNNMGLIGADGNILIYPGDRVERIEDENGNIQETFPDPPGLYVVQVGAAGYGLTHYGVSQFNLVDIVCEFRQLGD